jgi:hypothetical protein|nr:MAG TPA: hypothetical protein [Caudoviricetes sp.]
MNQMSNKIERVESFTGALLFFSSGGKNEK